MTKLSYFIVFSVLFIFAGCSKPSALVNFNYDKFYANSLQHTFKNDIVVDNNIVGMLNATYLNATKKSIDNDKDEIFLVGVFISNDEKDTSINNGYAITLNDLAPKSIYELKKEDKMYGKMPLFNPWAKYYVVRFDKEKLNENYLSELTKKEKYKKPNYKKIELKLSITEEQTTTLTFQKEL